MPGSVLAALLCIALMLPSGVGPAEVEFDFRGRIVHPDGRPFRGQEPLLFMEGATFPFSAFTQAKPDGSFVFKDLSEGLYRFVVIVPGWGEMEQTVEISRVLADSKGRIGGEYVFKAERNSNSATVSPSQLEVSDSARRAMKRAERHLGQKDTPAAVREIEKALEDSPCFSEAWNRLGTIAFLERRFLDAERHFEKALECDPAAYAPVVNLGAAYQALGKFEGALELDRRAVEMRPDDALAHSQSGQVYFILGRSEEAERALLRARALDPSHFSYPQLVLAEIYRQRKDTRSEVTMLEEFLRLHPGVPGSGQLKQVLEEARSRQP